MAEAHVVLRRACTLSVLLVWCSVPVFAQLSAPPVGPTASDPPAILKNVAIDQHLNGQVPLEVRLVDEHGRDVAIGDFFGQRPVLLVFAYYNCPMLCTLVINGAVRALRTLSLDAGKDFELVVISIDPGETPPLALSKKASYLAQYGRPGGESGFHFLTGRVSSIKQVADAVGFKYAYDPATEQYAHPALVTIVTPAGRISSYLYGIDFPPQDLRLALVEAANGAIGTSFDQALLLCYHYDPTTGRYGVRILTILQLGGLATLIGVAALVIWLQKRKDAIRTRVRPVTPGR